MLALRLGCLQHPWFLYHTRSFVYSDTATSCAIVLIAHLVLHFFASLIHAFIVFIMSLDSSPSGVNNVRAAAISGPCNGRDSCSNSPIKAGSATSAFLAAIVAICVNLVLAVSHPYHSGPCTLISSSSCSTLMSISSSSSLVVFCSTFSRQNAASWSTS